MLIWLAARRRWSARARGAWVSGRGRRGRAEDEQGVGARKADSSLCGHWTYALTRRVAAISFIHRPLGALGSPGFVLLYKHHKGIHHATAAPLSRADQASLGWIMIYAKWISLSKRHSIGIDFVDGGMMGDW